MTAAKADNKVGQTAEPEPQTEPYIREVPEEVLTGAVTMLDLSVNIQTI